MVSLSLIFLMFCLSLPQADFLAFLPSCFCLILPNGTFLPSGLTDANAGSLISTLNSLGGVGGVGEEGVAAAIAETPGWQGAALIDLVSGKAALSGGTSGEGAVPLGFRLGPGCKEVEFWPEQPPLSWVEYPVPPPPPVVPKDPNGEEAEEETPAEGEAGDDEDGEGKKSKPPPPPALPPIHHTNPVAPGVLPRVFVIFPTGEGNQGSAYFFHSSPPCVCHLPYR